MGRIMSKAKPTVFASNDIPLVVVLGATGAGKSKLSLDIAQRLDGEIINADAMQMYKGLDIVTNKVTPDERKICRHHMIGFLSPRNQYTVVDFQEQALKTIEDIHRRNKIPIVVGGTNYYVESVLWDFLIQRKSSKKKLLQSVDEIRKDLYQLSCMELYKRLKEVDPQLASTTHPKDKRKVIRGLEVYLQTGKPMSEHISSQQQQPGSGDFGGPLRFPRSCVFWVQCEADVLKERVERRVDEMMSSGLLKELSDFHQDFNKERLTAGLEPNYEHGIFQSIGFKEFHNYLTQQTSSESEKEKLLHESIERMKTSTWQYAKSQTKWIRKRIVNRRNSTHVYALDGSSPALWEERVLSPALQVLFSFYSSSPNIGSRLRGLVDEHHACPKPMEKDISGRTKESQILKSCDICGGMLVPSNQWEAHVTSKNHKRLFGMLKKQQQNTVAILNARETQLEEEQCQPCQNDPLPLYESNKKSL